MDNPRWPTNLAHDGEVAVEELSDGLHERDRPFERRAFERKKTPLEHENRAGLSAAIKTRKVP